MAPTAPPPSATAHIAEEGCSVEGSTGSFSGLGLKDVPSALFSWPELCAVAQAGRWESAVVGRAAFRLISSSFLVSIPLLKFLICSCTVHFFLEGLQHSNRGYFKPHMMVPAPGPCQSLVLLHVPSPHGEFACFRGPCGGFSSSSQGHRAWLLLIRSPSM